MKSLDIGIGRPYAGKTWWLALLLALQAPFSQALADPPKSDDDLLDLTFDQLLSYRLVVPGALTKLTRLESPAATTIITAEDIRLTPARNLYDLIEVYVPGAYWMMSATGPKLGVRGNISSRNYKYLLVLNGRVMNEKASVGASSELETWDLSDIERIEIVSGPGSVTYGPGAVAGVISITTFKPDAARGDSVSVAYVDPYQSKMVAASKHLETEQLKMFAHVSVTRTPGQMARTFQVSNNNTLGFVGDDVRPGVQPLDYYGDFKDQPQVKAHLALEFANGWSWWTRYTQQGSNWFSNEVKSTFNGEQVDQQGLRSRQFTSTASKDLALGDKMNLATVISLGGYDFERRGENVFSTDRDNALNYRFNYSSKQLVVRSTLNWQTAGGTQSAVGAEWTRDQYGPGWGDSPQQMRMGESGEIINGPDSQALKAGNGGDANRTPGQPAIYVGNGWGASTSSLFAETNLALNTEHKMLVSGRADKNTYTKWLLSGRLAWIWTMAEGQLLKLTGQRSSRMNTASQLFVNAQRGFSNDPERLDAIELRYSAQWNKTLAWNLSAFHDNEEVVVFQGVDNINRLVGQLKLNGIEGDLHVTVPNGRFGVAVSMVRQQSWKMAPGVVTNNVSYSDYNFPINGTGTPLHRQLGDGNDLNNWPNDSIKLFGEYKVAPAWTVHADLRWFSRLQGALDGLAGLQQAVAGTAADTAAFKAAYARIAAEGAFASDARLNLLVDHAFSKAWSLQLYALNLLDKGNNKRYAYDEAGNTVAAPRLVRLVEEPRAFGARLTLRY